MGESWTVALFQLIISSSHHTLSLALKLFEHLALHPSSNNNLGIDFLVKVLHHRLHPLPSFVTPPPNNGNNFERVPVAWGSWAVHF